MPTSLAFYRDRLGFKVTYEGPEPDDIFFGIVGRGGAQKLIKSVGVDPVPNHTRDVKQGVMRWDAFVYVPDPDALAEEPAEHPGPLRPAASPNRAIRQRFYRRGRLRRVFAAPRLNTQWPEPFLDDPHPGRCHERPELKGTIIET